MLNEKWLLPILNDKWWDADSRYWWRIRYLTQRERAKDERQRYSKDRRR